MSQLSGHGFDVIAKNGALGLGKGANRKNCVYALTYPTFVNPFIERTCSNDSARKFRTAVLTDPVDFEFDMDVDPDIVTAGQKDQFIVLHPVPYSDLDTELLDYENAKAWRYNGTIGEVGGGSYEAGSTEIAQNGVTNRVDGAIEVFFTFHPLFQTLTNADGADGDMFVVRLDSSTESVDYDFGGGNVALQSGDVIVKTAGSWGVEA